LDHDWLGEWKRLERLYGPDVASTTIEKVWEIVAGGRKLERLSNYISRAGRREYLQSFRDAGAAKRMRVGYVSTRDRLQTPEQERRVLALEDLTAAFTKEPLLWEKSCGLDHGKRLTNTQRTIRRRARRKALGLPR
jgi:hypothetical protein